MLNWLQIRFLLIFFQISISAFLYAQSEIVETVTHPLPPVHDILQDRQGFMWFGSELGLIKYDGYRYTTFKHVPFDSTSLSNDWIWDCCEGENGNIWIATFGGGVNCFNRVTETFTHYRYNPADSNSISSDHVYAVYADREGILWVGTRRAGLNKLDLNAGQCTRYQHDPENPLSISDNTVLTIYEDQSGNLWLGTRRGGLNRFDRRKAQFNSYQPDPYDSTSISHEAVSAIMEGDSGELWIGTGVWMAADGGGLNLFDPNSGIFRRYMHNSEKPNSLAENRICSLFEDHAGTFWVGTATGGINKFDKNTGRFTRIVTAYNSEFLNGMTVLAIFEDSVGSLWIGTKGAGVKRLDRYHHRFSYYRHEKDNPNSLSGDIVAPIYEDRSGMLWIGCSDKGLNQYDPQRQKYTLYQHDPANSTSLSTNAVWSICEDHNGTLWIGTRHGGLNQFDRAAEAFRHYRYDPQDSSSIGSDNILCMYEDRSHVLWLGTFGGGLAQMKVNANGDIQFINFRHDPQDPESISDNNVRAIYEDREGTLWLGTDIGGISCLRAENRQRGVFSSFKYDPKNPASLSSDRVNVIYGDNQSDDRTLWIGTSGGGLNQLDVTSGKFVHFTENDGLAYNDVYGILSDNAGNLWISTAEGLSKFDLSSGSFENYFTSDGLPNDNFSGGNSYFKTHDGKMLFGGHGMIGFYPGDIQENTAIPPVVITDLKVFNQPVVLDTAISETRQIKLSYRDNVFAIGFAALNYITPEKNQYAYRLEGFNDHWIHLGNQREATYTNLDPGSYVLRIKGSNNDGIWNEQGASLRIVITPPFWQTWWFRGLAFMAIVCILYLAYRYRVNRLLELERMRIQIASDLHDDIGSTLTKITVHSEIIQTTDNLSKINASAKKIGDMGREVVTTLSDIVWSIDARNDTVGDLLDRMRDFTDSMFSPDMVEIVFKAEGLNSAQKLPQSIRQNIYLIFKEAVNNIAKHTRASQVIIELSHQDGRLMMAVSDNGAGRTVAGKRSGHGLKNMQMRAARIGGALTIENESGARVVLMVKAD